MTREQLTAPILERYSADQDSPRLKYPEHVVFRHPNSRKWFALLMRIPKNRPGLDGGGLAPAKESWCKMAEKMQTRQTPLSFQYHGRHSSIDVGKIKTQRDRFPSQFSRRFPTRQKIRIFTQKHG